MVELHIIILLLTEGKGAKRFGFTLPVFHIRVNILL